MFFENYNAAEGRSAMYYGDTTADKLQRRYRKLYSEDGSMEILNDTQAGSTGFVFYLGGDAYSAPAIWKEVHTSSAVGQNLYYLHRDYLGSILMVTDNQGEVKEKRQFDAWGNIVKLTDGNGNPLTAFVILDRGYTGHEHLLGVALVHMNGRLYDPMLHRFLSPDNFVQDPFNSQNFNRYGYVMNNPLKYTDPRGEFIPLLAIGIGALIGAITGGAAYAGGAIRTGDWSWGKFGMSVLGGAAFGGLTGGINPMSVIGTASLGGVAASGFASGLLPSANISIGSFGFSLSPSIAFGNSFGVGANLSVGYSNGNFSISGGLGYMAYSNYQGFGTRGSEIRESLMAAYNDGGTGFSLGANFWSGTGGMGEFKQQTGVLGFRSGDFSVLYENDGGFGIKNLELGDKGDRYRTAALNLSYKDFSAGFNLFTGKRYNVNDSHEIINSLDDFGRKYKRGYVDERGTPYRLGLLTFGYKNYSVGVNSEHVRHAIQDRFIHGLIGDAGFQNISWGWSGYGQYKTSNIFSSW